MGGYISVALREPEGKIHKLTKWTNDLCDFAHNDLFFESDSQYISQYVNDEYAEEDSLSPDGYGLVVFDFKTKTILSCQGYCEFGKIDLVSLKLENLNKHKPHNKTEAVKRLVDKRMIRQYEKVENFNDLGLLPVVSSLEVGNMIKNTDISMRTWVRFIIDPGDWNIEEYDEGWLGYQNMLIKIKDLGFLLSKEEENEWASLLKTSKIELLSDN